MIVPEKLGRCVITGLLLPAIVALFAAGCAPKRVARLPLPTDDSVERPPAPGRARPAGPPSALPLPSRRPRSGLATPGVTDLPSGVAAAELAAAQIGKPYAYGAAGPDRFDCSGLTSWVYGRLGVSLPRVARAQARSGSAVALHDAAPGDLLFFAIRGGGIDHVGVYLGGRRFVHAPRRGRRVGVDSLSNSYWRARLRTIRRVLFPQESRTPSEN